MKNKFDVYKWRREQLNESEDNLATKAEKVYNSIKRFLEKDHNKDSVIRELMFAMRSTSDNLTEETSPNQLFDAFKKLTSGAGSHYPEKKLIKVVQRYAPDDNKAREFFKEKGYTVKIEEWEAEPGERLGEIWYYYS